MADLCFGLYFAENKKWYLSKKKWVEEIIGDTQKKKDNLVYEHHEHLKIKNVNDSYRKRRCVKASNKKSLKF